MTHLWCIAGLKSVAFQHNMCLDQTVLNVIKICFVLLEELLIASHRAVCINGTFGYNIKCELQLSWVVDSLLKYYPEHMLSDLLTYYPLKKSLGK